MISNLSLNTVYKIAETLTTKQHSVREAYQQHNIMLTLVQDQYTLLFQSREQETIFRLKYSEYL